MLEFIPQPPTPEAVPIKLGRLLKEFQAAMSQGFADEESPVYINIQGKSVALRSVLVFGDRAVELNHKTEEELGAEGATHHDID